MATVYITVAQAGQVGQGAHGFLPVMRAPFQSETITSSASVAYGAKIATHHCIVKVECATALYVLPTQNDNKVAATAANGMRVTAGVPEYIAMTAGDVLGVIDG